VVTFPVLGAVVRDIVDDAATVTVLMPNGLDPHEWSPSARAVARMTHADLVVANGVDLEEGAKDALAEARRSGVPVFEAAAHVRTRNTGHAEGGGEGTPDPHLWLDPLAVRDVATALVAQLRVVGIEPVGRGQAAIDALTTLDGRVRELLAAIPPGQRRLVTGHDSMGWFADRYGFSLIGSMVPGLSSEAEVSAKQLSALRDAVRASGVPAVFTETGTPQRVARALSRAAHVRVVPLSTHRLPADGTYASFILNLASSVAGALR